ncbi:MAG: hypothetical protein R2867_32965 [Caldilineaceae bacterium]
MKRAGVLLHQVLALTEQHFDGSERPKTDQFGVRSSLQMTPLWESRAYALSQLGNIAMFHGRFIRQNSYIWLVGIRSINTEKQKIWRVWHIKPWADCGCIGGSQSEPFRS